MTNLKELIHQAKNLYDNSQGKDESLRNMVFKLSYELEKLCEEMTSAMNRIESFFGYNENENDDKKSDH